MLLGAEAAITKHTSLYVESGDSTAGNTGNLIGSIKVGLQARCFPVMVWLNSWRGTALCDLLFGDPGPRPQEGADGMPRVCWERPASALSPGSRGLQALGRHLL